MSESTQVYSVLKSFIKQILQDGRPNLVHEVLLECHIPTSEDIGTRPEEYIEDHLIWPILNVLELVYTKRPYNPTPLHPQWPDFKIDNLQDKKVIGEVKPLNKYLDAKKDINGYLDRRSIGADYGIATDGAKWGLYHMSLSGDVAQMSEVKVVDLWPALMMVGKDAGVLPEDAPGTQDEADASVEELVEFFDRESLLPRLSSEIPKWLREERQKGVDDFYNLYIELLFGEGSKYKYQTCLVNEVKSVENATELERRLFAITLINRLLFIKFLEDVGVLKTGFLAERVADYREGGSQMVGSLYETQLKPLFYNLLNTKEEDRSQKHRQGWFAEVPYLNGGLFRPNIANERSYAVSDGILKKVVEDLVEGHRLRKHYQDRRLDPAILGSVFEKTITYIESERTQKGQGAYYTPDDVTSIIVRDTISRKAKDIVVEAAIRYAGGDADFKKTAKQDLERKTLEELLQDVENANGWLGKREALEEMQNRLLRLRMVDPACGSGHFLTSLMSELYRLWEAVYRGRNGQMAPSDENRYNSRKTIALNCIYGVDIDPIAVEIAKLRIWLKIIEDIEWKPGFGALPNIDLNILAGNSLVGLPLKGAGQLPFGTEKVERLAELREQHKYDEKGRKRDVQRLQRRIQSAADSAFLSQFHERCEWNGKANEEMERFLKKVSSRDLFSTAKLFKIRSTAETSLSEDQAGYLDDWGATTYKNIARLKPDALAKRFQARDGLTLEKARESALEWLGELPGQDLAVSAIERGPLQYDIEELEGNPFHWPVYFPELTGFGERDHDIKFDVVVGNPPYGDLLGPSEKFFLERYQTKGVSDISALFVERQLQLLREGGYFGNVTTAQLVFKSSLSNFHDLLRHQMRDVKIASFAKRPMKVFAGAEVRCAIITGRKANGTTPRPLRTSDFIRFSANDRDERLRNISYEEADPFILTDCIGGSRSDGSEILPKVGHVEIKNILQHWTGMKYQIADYRTNGENSFDLYRRRGSDYWLCAMIDPLYQSSTIKPIHFESEEARDAAFLIIHSSLFYLYWMVYGDQFHLNTSMITRFPFFPPNMLSSNRYEIADYRSKLWSRLQEVFDFNTKQFNMRPIKPLVDEVDDLLGEMFGMSKKMVEFAKNYQAEYRV